MRPTLWRKLALLGFAALGAFFGSRVPVTHSHGTCYFTAFDNFRCSEIRETGWGDDALHATCRLYERELWSEIKQAEHQWAILSLISTLESRP